MPVRNKPRRLRSCVTRITKNQRRRVVIAKFVAHRHKEVQNKAKKVVGIVNLYEVQCADGKAPTVQTWCPRNVQTVEEAAAQCPCTFKEGQKMVVGFD